MRYALKQTVAPVEEPLTTAEAKAHLLVTHSDDDTLIARQIVAARRWVEQQTQRQLVTASWRLSLDDFPRCGDRIMEVPRPPLVSVTSITYYDEDGNSQTLASSKYVVDSDSEPARIAEAPDQTWPSTQSRLNAVQVTYSAGFGDESAVPENLKAAMLLLIGHWYENREAVALGTISTVVDIAVHSLLDAHIVARAG